MSYTGYLRSVVIERDTDAVQHREDEVEYAQGEGQGMLAREDGVEYAALDETYRIRELGRMQIPFSYSSDDAAESVYRGLMSLLPSGIRTEIEGMAAAFPSFVSHLSEVTLRSGGVCTLRLDGRLRRLRSGMGQMEMEGILRALTRGAMYAYHDRIRRGYLTPSFGGRVGIIGVASVEEGDVGAVTRPSTLVFRIPKGRVCGGERLASFFRREVKVGWLLLSAPGVGKTSALRALARALSRGEGGCVCVAVDEREEFLSSDREGGTLDVLSGYPRALGMEIALRSLGAQVILVDEIGSEEDVEGMRQHLLAGVPIVATAHASSLEEGMRRPLLSRILSMHAFDVVSVMKRDRDGVLMENYRVL